MLVGHIDRIGADRIDGWAADTDKPDSVEDVIIYVDGKRTARIACDRLRPDLRDLRDYGRGLHGFTWEVSPPIPAYLLDRITVRFARSGTTVPNGDATPAACTGLQAILVTAPGRSGTTLMMHRLSRSPQVCVAETHPFEVRLMSYWSTVVTTLTGPADYERSMHPDRLEGDGLKVGANPFVHQAYAEALPTRTLATEYFATYVSRQLIDTARTAIREYYLRIMDDRPKPHAMFFAEKNNNLDRRTRDFARTLFANLKEIVLIRDPRDLLCSQMAYFRRDPETTVGELTFATRELLRIKREEADRVLFVKYEDLILDAEHAHARLALHLGVEQSHVVNVKGEQAGFNSHATSESPTASIGRWNTQLTEQQRHQCDTNWQAFLSEFGYA